MATTARHSGSIRAKEGVTDGGEAPSEDGGVVIIMTGQRQTFGKYSTHCCFEREMTDTTEIFRRKLRCCKKALWISVTV